MSKKVLIVDDNEELRIAVTEIVKSGGFEAKAVENGKVAQDILAEYRPDLIISDLQMPHVDGLELLSYVKKNTKIPFILMTAFTQIIETQRAFELGADDFFAKPFKNEDVLRSVQRILGHEAEKKEESNLDHMYCRIPIQDFVSHEIVRVNIHIRLSSAKYIRVAHKGDNIPTERVDTYKTKGVSYLYANKKDFAQLIGFNISLSQKISANSNIDFEKKANFLRYTTETVLENIAVNGIDQTAYDDAKECIKTYLELISESFNIFEMIRALNNHADWLYAHSLGVGAYSIMIAKKMGWTSSQTFFKLGMSGLLHDIGQKEIDISVLEKPRVHLSQQERQLYETHSIRGREILETLREIPDEISQIVCEHHENCHGQGYPRRISKERIHPLAKVVAVADVFCYESLKTPNFCGYDAPTALQRVGLYEGLDPAALNALRALCTA